MTEDNFFEFWIALIRGFGIIEVAVTGFFFTIALASSGKVFSYLFNMMNMPAIFLEQKGGVFSLVIAFFKGWLLAVVILLLLSLMLVMFFFYGLLFSYAIGLVFELFNIQPAFNKESATIGIALALFLGNSASVVRALSKRIRWLELSIRYPNDYQRQYEEFNTEQFNTIDFDKDNINK